MISSGSEETGYRGGMSTDEFRRNYAGKVVKLGSNENANGPSPAAAEAASDAAGLLNRYPPVQDTELREALAAHWGGSLTPDHFVTGNGGADVISLICQWQLDANSECVISRPTFPVYEMFARREGATVVFADLRDNDFSYDVEAVLAAITGRTRLVFVCSPNNPTGNACEPASVRRLVESVPEHVLVVLDEVYHHFSNNRRRSFEIIEGSSGVVLIHSFSKAFGLAGARLGYAIARPQIAREIARYRLPFHINSLTTVAGLAALRDHDHLESTITSVRSERDRLSKELARLQIDVYESEANFIMFRTPHAPADVSEGLLSRGVIVRPLEGFYLPDHLRVTVGTPEENRTFITALEETLTLLSKG